MNKVKFKGLILGILMILVALNTYQKLKLKDMGHKYDIKNEVLETLELESAQAIRSLEAQTLEMIKEIEALKAQGLDYEGRYRALEGLLADQVAVISDKTLLKIYGLKEAYIPYVRLYIKPQGSLEDQVDLLLESLEADYFYGLNMTLVGLEAGEAVIDLTDGPQVSWQEYFQGSAGGYATTYILVQAMLQRDYGGKWLEGVSFTYAGEANFDLDHVNLFNQAYKRYETYFEDQ